jgi:threonine/homoserine/homoserine lactone efflux protein
MIPLLSTFFLISLTGALSPGPLTTMAITEGARRGKWSGWWLSLGHGVSEGTLVVVLSAFIIFGQESLLALPLATRVIAVAGGAFLTWMGWGLLNGAWRGRLSLAAATGMTKGSRSDTALVSKGVLFSVSNPYWWVWWVVVTPVFIREAMLWSVLGVVLLFSIHWLSDVLWLTGLSYLTGSGRSLVGERLYRWVLIGCGAALVFFGLFFAIAGLQGELNLSA